MSSHTSATISGLTIEGAVTVEDIDALDLLPVGIVLQDEDGDEWRKEAHDIFFHLGNPETENPYDYGVFHGEELVGPADEDETALVILNPELLALSIADGASAAGV